MEGQGKGERQVTTQFGALDDALERMHDRIGKLEERLSSVVRDEPETKNAEEARQDLVLLADRIRHYATKADHAAARLQDIMARLEL